jgi:hypothetical protein
MMDKDRFHKILLMLSASTPGEVYNAAQLLGRFLKDNGYDWYDFAAKVTNDFKGIKEAAAEKPSPSRKSTKRQRQDVWYRSQSGNLVGTINRQKCTILRSKYNNDEFVAVINTEDGDTRWWRGFHSEGQAQEFMMNNY